MVWRKRNFDMGQKILTEEFSRRGLTFGEKCATFQHRKALTKTRAFGKIPREDAPVVKGTRTPAESDTTSEPQIGNGLPGAPVIASMSGSAPRGNQGGTVEYCFTVSHP